MPQMKPALVLFLAFAVCGCATPDSRVDTARFRGLDLVSKHRRTRSSLK